MPLLSPALPSRLPGDYEENLYYGHRHVTMLVYLNTVPEAHGGYTAQPKPTLTRSRARTVTVLHI
jgi:hypothetical protein